ncbi:sugar transferase [Hahella sp. CCB-MM4]|nr:sugar transferase [Hahella sp. CCB-MM4]
MRRLSRGQVKRMTDVVLAIVAVTMFLPLWLLVGLLILLEDGSPVIFLQTRLGKDKHPITVIKLRTMRAGKVTRIGKWLRSTGLDESLQFLPVLAGTMSIVGPRPLTEADIHRIGWGGEKHADRWKISPGITGMAQLFSGRGARVSLYFDRYYLRRQSLILDVSIICLSFMVTLVGKKRVQTMIRNNRRHTQAGLSGFIRSQLSRNSPGVVPSQDLNQR